MTTKDFTKKQAARWVDQEFAKHRTVPSMLARIDATHRAVANFAKFGLDKQFPMSSSAHTLLIAALQAEAARLIGIEFVKVLREWITNPRYWDGEYAGIKSAEDAWAKMCADNARLHAEGSTCCASHDWCDANMAMFEAFENLDLDPLPDDDAERERMTDLWNAAWASASPALRGEAGA